MQRELSVAMSRHKLNRLPVTVCGRCQSFLSSCPQLQLQLRAPAYRSNVPHLHALADLPALAQLTTLRSLALPTVDGVTSSCLQQLSALMRLTSLDAGRASCCPLPQLRSLAVQGRWWAP